MSLEQQVQFQGLCIRSGYIRSIFAAMNKRDTEV